MQVTATEKKLIDAYRSASAENKKLALNLLQGKAVEDSEGLNVGSILQNSLSSGLGGVLETLISGLGKENLYNQRERAKERAFAFYVMPLV